MIKPNILSFIGSLLPIVFPKYEFKPERLVAVIVSVLLVILLTRYIGLENTSIVLEYVEDLVKMAEE